MCAFALTSREAWAQTSYEASPSVGGSEALETRHHAASVQNFAVELRFALYQPQVDSDPALGGNTPFANTFSGQTGYEGGIEFDWQALHIPNIGSLGPGLGVGYYTISGQANVASTGIPSSESTTLEILPIYLVGVFRLDVLWRRFGIPVVPYAKAGLGYALWRASNSVGVSVSREGVVGEGHTWGSQLAAGLAFNLGVFDPTTVKNLDDLTGINGTYIFAEYMASTLDGIAQKDPLRVGTDCFVFGLAFEF
ncbi:MAG: MXAN_2562 family outer membrane beta-barrel protein [Polyangiaceae bacterium]